MGKILDMPECDEADMNSYFPSTRPCPGTGPASILRRACPCGSSKTTLRCVHRIDDTTWPREWSPSACPRCPALTHSSHRHCHIPVSILPVNPNHNRNPPPGVQRRPDP